MLNTKEDIWKNVGNQTVAGSIVRNKKIIWKSMATVNCLIANILADIFFCVLNRRKKTGLGE